ncbi:hypothetical protein AHAS_Ahas16G0141700 [Arachis hypogaea]
MCYNISAIQQVAHKIKGIAKNYHDILALTEKSNDILQASCSVLVGWKLPDEGWYKVNVDGSVLQARDSGACGGLIRDSNDMIVAGFMMNIGKVTITAAELWAIYLGFKIVIEMGLKKVRMETDSTCAVKLQ